MTIPPDTNTMDLYQLGHWYCPKCKGIVDGVIEESIFHGTCDCGHEWFVRIPKIAGYYRETRLENRKPKHEEAKVAIGEQQPASPAAL